MNGDLAQGTVNGDLAPGVQSDERVGKQSGKIAWIATRKFLHVAEEAIGEHLLNSFLLHSVLHVKSPLPELTAASHVAIELPANVEKGFEQLALDFHERV